MVKNGVIIQDLSKSAFNLPKFNHRYLGVNSFWTDPLAKINDAECKSLSEKTYQKQCDDGYIMLEFVSDPQLLFDYITKCKEKNIDIRVLQIESDYQYETCAYDFPIAKFLGFEFCEIPFDSQVITDFDWYTQFHKYYKNLNEYGLFDTVEAATEFKREYEREWKIGNIGDGEMDTYIGKVSEVDIDAFIDSYTRKNTESIYERSPDVEVVFEFNGTRKRKIYDGFRPVHKLPNGYLTSGLHHYFDVDEINSNESINGTITFVSPEYYPNCLNVGSVIAIYDFPNIIGHATVTKILNPTLRYN